MALNKVEICGVNTSRLPILSEEEKNGTVPADQAGRQRGEGTLYQGESAPGFKRDQTVFQQQRGGGRPFPDRMYRSDEGHRQF